MGKALLHKKDAENLWWLKYAADPEIKSDDKAKKYATGIQVPAFGTQLALTGSFQQVRQLV